MLTILVPLDGSTGAAAALPHALGIADRFDGKLRLLTARDEAARQFYGEKPDDRARQRWEYLAAMGKLLHSHTELISGYPSEVIVQEAETLEADLIVMGLNAHLGPVADYVARNAPCPVLLIPAEHHTTEEAEGALHRATAGDYPRYGRILLELDGTLEADRSLAPAVRLAQSDESRLTLWGPAEVRTYLEDCAARLRVLGCSVESEAADETRNLTISTRLDGTRRSVNGPILVVRGTTSRLLSLPAL